MAGNCSEDRSLHSQIPKNGIYHMRWGGSPWTFSLPRKNGWYENWGAPPPNVGGGIFIYFSIRGLLSWTICCNPFWNRRKIEKVVYFLKKTSVLPLFTDIFCKKGGGSFFGNCVNRSIFVRNLKKKASNCSEEQSSSIQVPKQLVSTTLGGRGEPVYFHIYNFLGLI